MNQVKNKIKYIAVTVVFTIIINLSFISSAQAAVSANDLISLTNSIRSQDGLSTLSTNDQLTAAALAKANDMFADQYFAHNSPSGKTPWDFISEAGYDYVYAGENLAIGYSDNNDLFNAWMNSITHRDNIINPNYRDIGMVAVSGTYEGAQTTIVVQEFGSKTTTIPVVASATNQNINSGSQDLGYSVDLNKTTYLPNKIFVGEEVTLKTTIIGKVSEVYFTIGKGQINLKEELATQVGNETKSLEKSTKITEEGDLAVDLVIVDQWGNKHNQTLGKLQVLPTVISKNNTNSDASGNIGNLFHHNTLPITLTLVLILAIGGYLIYRHKTIQKITKFI